MTQKYYGPRYWGCTSKDEFVESLQYDIDNLNDALPNYQKVINNLMSLPEKNISTVNECRYSFYNDGDDDGNKDSAFLLFLKSSIQDLIEWLDELKKQTNTPYIEKICEYKSKFDNMLNYINKVLTSEDDYYKTHSDVDINELIQNLFDKLNNGTEAISDCIYLFNEIKKQTDTPYTEKLCEYKSKFDNMLKDIDKIRTFGFDYFRMHNNINIDELIEHLINRLHNEEKAVSDCIDLFKDFKKVIGSHF